MIRTRVDSVAISEGRFSIRRHGPLTLAAQAISRVRSKAVYKSLVGRAT